MNLLKKDYIRLYELQDRFLRWWVTLQLPFYLTGGTALGRFYLNHRYSEDLDFFLNSNSNYSKYILSIKNQITSQFTVNMDTALFTDDFTRLIINDNDIYLKVEFVNDIEYRSGEVNIYDFGLVDTPYNILSNKLSALIGRDEAKDIFDIVHLALNYNFNWLNIFQEAKKKTIINEIEVEERLSNFPVEWLENVDWMSNSMNYDSFKQSLKIISDDFLLGKDNSLCTSNKIKIEEAFITK